MRRILRVAAAVFALVAAQCCFAGDVTGIDIGSGAVTLDRADAGWTVRQLDGAAAPAEKVRAFLDILLAGEFSPVAPAAESDAGATGLDGDAGLRVALNAGADGETVFAVGLHPAGDFDSTYLRTPDGTVVLAKGDLRGMLGLWANTPDETPEPLVWLDTRALRFDPELVVSLTANYPDHTIRFVKNADDNAWELASPAPGGEWSGDGLRQWLADLADFRIAGIAPAAGASDTEAGEGLAHSIVLGFADGSETSVRVLPGSAEEDAVAVVSGIPERAFVLPRWRFADYFYRLDSLFPGAVPHFAVEDVLLLDIRNDDGSVKITRRDDGWEPVALSCAARAERLERLAHLLARWRPVDFTDVDAAAEARPDFGVGGTVVEVVLAGGGVHQYRLSGTHPVLPWRYVTLDGERVFSVTGAAAAVMFPRFADVLELGPEAEPAPEPEPAGIPIEVPVEEPVEEEPAEPVEPEPELLVPPAEIPVEPPVRKIVPAEVDFSGSVAEKAAQ